MTRRPGFLLLFLYLFVMISHAQAQDSFFKNVDASFTYTGDIFANVYGGIETGARYSDNIDVELSFDISTFSFYFYGLGNQGKSISEIVGDIQTLSNIDAENSWGLYEAWVEKSFPAIRTSFLFGLYDLNSEFDVINNGQLFLNSSHGIGPDFSSSGILGPSIFPNSSLSARLKISPVKGVYLKGVVLDGVPSNPANTRGTSVIISESDGFLVAGEISISKEERSPEHSLKRGIDETSPYRLALGAWKYNQEREGWLGDLESDHGLYVIAESILIREKDSEKREGLSAFARFGVTNRDINRFNAYFGGGFTYKGLFKNRDDDELGLSVAHAINSDDYITYEDLSGNDFSESELTTEFTYLFIVSDVVSFQIDTQYIMNPNQAPDIDDAFVIGVRSVFSF